MTLGFIISSVLLLVTYSNAWHLPEGQIAVKQTVIYDNNWKIQVTDGNVVVKATILRNGSMANCEVSKDMSEIKNLLSDKTVQWKFIGSYAVKEMITTCQLQTLVGNSRQVKTRQSGTTAEPFKPEETGQPSGAGLGVGIFPGTKWCGLGNEASSYDDLGKYAKTDACCREHDHCPYFIDHFETKYNFKNPYPWTLSHCDCDTKLYNCLKGVNTTASSEVGKLFYGLLSVKCFTFEKGQYCAERNWSQLFCEKSAYGEKAVTQDFPHKWSDSVLGRK